MSAYTIQGEWSTVTFEQTSEGVQVEIGSRMSGDLTGDCWLVPYRILDVERDAPLDFSSPWNEYITIADYIIERGVGHPESKILKRGHIVR